MNCYVELSPTPQSCAPLTKRIESSQRFIDDQDGIHNQLERRTGGHSTLAIFEQREWIGRRAGSAKSLGDANRSTLRKPKRSGTSIEAQKLANPGLPPPVLPNNDARRATLARHKAQYATLRKQAADLYSKTEGERRALRPAEFDPAERQDREEMRALARSLPQAEREALLRDPAFRVAFVESHPRLSGLAPSVHARLKQDMIMERFPDKVKALDAEQHAAELSFEFLKSIERALDAEATEIGEAPKPASEAPTQTWEQLEVK
jgi:hypothetical protein